jgi:hypothetical protein
MKKIVFLISIVLAFSMFANTIKIIESIRIPEYEQYTFYDLSKTLKNVKWMSHKSENKVTLSGDYYRKESKISLEFIVYLNHKNKFEKMIIVDTLFEKDIFVKMHKLEYQAKKCVLRKWTSYESYLNNPNKSPKAQDEQCINFKNELYKTLFKQ